MTRRPCGFHVNPPEAGAWDVTQGMLRAIDDEGKADV
jgi:hypothetical protein